MVKLINAVTGTDMYVAESRLVEYIAEGHKLAVEVPPAPPLPKKKTVAKKTAARKGTMKK